MYFILDQNSLQVPRKIIGAYFFRERAIAARRLLVKKGRYVCLLDNDKHLYYDPFYREWFDNQ